MKRSGKRPLTDSIPEIEVQGREIVVNNGPHSIWGRYPLYDLVSLTTTSGSVAVSLVPQPADPEKPDEPARLLIKTESGSVLVNFGHISGNVEDVSSLPRRPYQVEIQTQSGSISGVFPFSSSASLSTDEGSINAVLAPVIGREEDDVTISTTTSHGSQNIRLAEPVISHDVNERLSFIPTASHTSTDGSLNLHYPRHWAGNVHAWTGPSGVSCLNGRGLRVVKSGDGNAWAIKKPDDSPEYYWWGGRGGMNVSLAAVEDGAISFFVG